MFNLKKLGLKWKVMAGILLLFLLAGGGYYLLTTDWESPQAVTAKYFAAVQRGDFQTAYQMTGKTRYHETLKQFTDRVSNYGKDMQIKPVSASIDHGNAVVTLAYTVTTQFGKLAHEGTIELIWEQRAWKITNP